MDADEAKDYGLIDNILVQIPKAIKGDKEKE
jgi:ATP-dependent protease ClpP protease subunit